MAVGTSCVQNWRSGECCFAILVDCGPELPQQSSIAAKSCFGNAQAYIAT